MSHSIVRPSIRPRRGLLWRVDGDTTTLLSLDTGRYYTFNDSASVIWAGICARHALPDVAADVASRYKRVLEDVAEDVDTFVGSLRASGLIELDTTTNVVSSDSARIDSDSDAEAVAIEHGAAGVRTSAHEAAEPAAPSFLICLLALTSIHLALRLVNLRRVLRIVFETSRAGNTPDWRGMGAWCGELALRIQQASAWHPGHTQCLERSLCFLWLARRRGADVTLRLGVSPSPFAAHAWIESAGVPVNDHQEYLRLFRPFPPITAASL